MAANSRGVVELNDLIDRLDSLLVVLATNTTEEENRAEAESSDHEMEDEEKFDQVSQVEKEIRRKLMEIHSRLKNNANFLSFGDEESFFDEAAEHEEEETQSRAERRRKVSQQQQQQRQEDEVDESESDTNDLDSAKPRHPLPMLSVNSMGSSSANAKSSLLSTERAKAVLRQCLVVFGRERETEETLGVKKRIPFSDESKALAAQLIAEMARSELGRRLSLQHNVIAAVGLVLGDDDEDEVLQAEAGAEKQKDKAKRNNECSLETAVQVRRILGNLCFDCPEGRKQVLKEEKSLEKLSRLARNRENRTREDPGQRLPVILPGFLLNLCNTTPAAVEVIGRLGFVDVIVSNILATKTNDAVFNASLNLLICLSEELDTAKDHINNSKEFPAALTHILEYTTSPEVTQTVLELVRALIDCPLLALHLAKHTKLFETFLSHIIGKWQSSGEFELLRADACELLVVFLSHDDCMKEIYSVENGKFVETFADWLNLNDDPPLQVSAALAISNFACNEEIGLKLLGDSYTLTDKMIQLLSERQNPANDFKLQHGILGALRNFAVTPQARQILLDKGILSPCLSLFERLNMTSPAYHAVIFKLLGTLRLLVEGHSQAVSRIVDYQESEDVVSRLVAWGSPAEAPQGIRAECSRLLASMLKNSRSKQTMRSIVASGGLPPVTQMLHSSHVRMLNEALVALTVLAATFSGGEEAGSEDADLVHRHLHMDLIINGIKRCFCEEGTSMVVPVEVKMNAVTFTENLLKVKTEEFKQMLRDLNFVEDCLNEEALKTLPDACRLLAERLK